MERLSREEVNVYIKRIVKAVVYGKKIMGKAQ